MTFRCRVENGRIELPPEAVLPDGTEVDVRLAAPAPRPALKPARAAFGMWKNRTDLGPDPVKTLRARSRKRRSGKRRG